jgi:hypothetical protein
VNRRAPLIILLVAALAGAGAPAVMARWRPPPRLTWYWQLQGRPRIEPVMATDLDGSDTSSETVAHLHARGQRVICYVDVGTWENWRPDARAFPSSVLGRANGWPGERWLDVRRLSKLAPIMTRRFRACAHKHFDAVEPDNLDGFQNATGFHISAAQQLRYDKWVAARVHALGMAVFQKNDPTQAAALEPHFDGVLDEQCRQYAECGAFRPYLRAGKPVLDAEYRAASYPAFCAADRRLGIMGVLFSLALDGRVFKPCPASSRP